MKTKNNISKEKLKLDHKKAPIYDLLCQYKIDNRNSMHVPGHKDGRVFDISAHNDFLSILEIDATASVGIDDLHDPIDSIAESQALAADAFGADYTYFLVGGSTIGNLGIALSLFSPGDKVLVQRNMHKSVFNGLLFAGVHPIYISPAMEPTTNVAMISDIQYIENALKEHSDVKAIWVTNPNYYGMSRDIHKLALICENANIPLIVDEAHGAHFGQSEEVPPSALSQGANIVVQSTHKMLTSMHMTSMLHTKGSIVPNRRLSEVLSMIQSTSPSYPLLASLDLSRRYLVQHGRNKMNTTIKRLEKKRINLNSELETLTIWGGSKEVDRSDPLKWIVFCQNKSITGYELLELFYNEGWTAEISDPRNIVFIFSLDEEEENINQIARAIKVIDQKITSENLGTEPIDGDMILFKNEGSLYHLEMSLQKAFYSPKRQVKLEDSIDCFCGETVLPYPPGIPLLTPGEKITSDHIHSIKKLREMGGYFQTPSDSTFKTITVLVDKD